MGGANDKQVGGEHYRSSRQHWDVVAINEVGYLEGNASKYLTRWRKKNGVQDLEKAAHYIEKAIELAKAGLLTNNSLFISLTGKAAEEKDLELVDFIDENEISDEEGEIIIQLFCWESFPSLEYALKQLQELIQREKQK